MGLNRIPFIIKSDIMLIYKKENNNITGNRVCLSIAVLTMRCDGSTFADAPTATH